MKRIIDIPEEVVTAIQNGEDYRYDIHTAIAQGIPYEPKGDLISREALKKCARIVFDKDLGRLRVVDVSDIDNAPTVEAERKSDNLPSCNSCLHNGTWDCIKCKGFDKYERR